MVYYTLQKTLEENENAISEDEKKAIIDAAADLEETLKKMKMLQKKILKVS